MEEEKEIKEHGLAQELEVDEQAMLQLLVEANAIERGMVSDRLTINGHTWRLRPTSKWQNKAMLNHDYDVMYWQGEMKEGVSRKRAKRINAKISRAYAKKAAHRVLGRRLWLVPGAFLLTWLRLYLSDERICSTINAADAVSEKRSFTFANLGSSKQALGLSTIQVGNAVKQMQERKASAESMLGEDASVKNQEGSKSPRPSKARATTRR